MKVMLLASSLFWISWTVASWQDKRYVISSLDSLEVLVWELCPTFLNKDKSNPGIIPRPFSFSPSFFWRDRDKKRVFWMIPGITIFLFKKHWRLTYQERKFFYISQENNLVPWLQAFGKIFLANSFINCFLTKKIWTFWPYCNLDSHSYEQLCPCFLDFLNNSKLQYWLLDLPN